MRHKMESKILKTINRLETFNIDDIVMITAFDEENIQKCLEIFVKQKKIRKISDETYSIITEKTPIKKKEIVKKTNVKQKIFEFTPQELEIYNNAPNWARKPAEKYFTVLKLTHGLTGKRLKDFLKIFNERNPELKTSYSAVNSARLKLRKDGLIGLLAKYSIHNKGHSCVQAEMYSKFKELYLSKQAPSFLNCYTKLKNEYYLKGVWQIPGYLSFVRRIKAEFTSEQISFFRGKC
jgi:hypothetical protein